MSVPNLIEQNKRLRNHICKIYLFGNQDPGNFLLYATHMQDRSGEDLQSSWNTCSNNIVLQDKSLAVIAHICKSWLEIAIRAYGIMPDCALACCRWQPCADLQLMNHGPVGRWKGRRIIFIREQHWSASWCHQTRHAVMKPRLESSLFGILLPGDHHDRLSGRLHMAIEHKMEPWRTEG